ncbi:MAG TPA: FimV/HubP family polar landmark protein [Methylophilaceae bacterium]
MHQLKIKRLLAAVSLALMPLVIVPQMSYAAGLGKLRVNSGLGEPLSAEIDVLSATTAELDSLEAKIASDSVYESQGIERPSLYNAIRVEVKKKSGGAVLKLSSAEAITEPFLDMLIQMDWGSGQLLREYNLLLDPPGYNKQKNVEAPIVKVPKEESLATKPEESVAVATEESPKKTKKTNKKSAKKVVEPKPQAEKPAESSAPQATESASNNTEGYTTKSGDSLSSIAKKSLQDGVNLDQYMVAMFRANQDAFNRQNMNRLKVGQIVKMPSADEAKAIAPTEARKEVVLHSKDWNNYKNNLADQVAHSSGQDSGEQGENQSKGKISAKAEDKAAASTGPRDVVKLSKSDGKGTNPSQAELSALQDELVARDNAIKEANTKSAMLEKRIADMEKLLTLKSQGMAEAQKSAAATQEPVKPTETKKTAEVKPAVEPAKPTETAKPEAAKPSEAATGEPQYTTVVTQPPAQTETDKAKPEAKPTETPKPTQATKSAEETTAPSMFDGLLGDPMLLGGAAGGLALLGGAWLFIRNKRKRGLDNLEKAIQTTSGLKENTVFGNTEGASIGSGTTSFLTDFSQSGGGMIDTHDVDPIAEAEVYMAYGRDAQAEEILKDAIAKDPKRAELHLKLLELYAGRKDTHGFETVAGELYSTIGAEDPLWAKAALLGRGIEPNNPLYQAGEVEATPAATQEVNPFTSALSEPEEIEYSVDAGLPEDAVESNEMDIHAMDADFAAIESFGKASDESSEASPELEFSLDQNHSESDLDTLGLGALASEGGSSPLAEDEALVVDNGLDFPAFNEQDLGVSNEGVADAEQTVTLTAEPFETESLKTDSHDTIDNEIDFPDFSGLEVAEVDEAALADSEPLIPENLETDVVEFANPDSDQLATLASKTQDKLEEINLDLPDVYSPAADISSLADELTFPTEAKQSNVEEKAPALDLPSFDLSDMDLSDSKTDAATLSAEQAPVETASTPEVDFSKIDLDLGVEAATPASTTEVNSLADEFDMEAESSEVETKLDLVTAYIDMGDQEGAKELLEEVLKEGGPQQRIRAQDMLKSLA